MKVAIVHDYLKEYGGAERVLEALTEVFPDAPIYTAFFKEKSVAYEKFKHKKIIPSWAHSIPFFASKLHSPLRFLAPLIWESFDLSKYDVVISSASWYITKGFKKPFEKSHFIQHLSKSHNLLYRLGCFFLRKLNVPRKKGAGFIEICYCHTPPRWLYGYSTSVNFQKYPLVKAYAAIIGHFMRLYDFKSAQKVDYFIANSKEVAGRIAKFYRRNSTVIYPPVSLPKSFNVKQGDYYFIVSRIVGGKGLDLAIDAALKIGFKLKIAGSPSGYYFEQNKLIAKAQGKVEFLGQVTDKELAKLYKGAKAFLALAKDEDFGITPVEAMSVGTPVIAFNGGGYKETVLQGRTGLLFDDYTADGLIKAIKQFEKMNVNPEDCIKQAEKFSKERFKREILNFVNLKVKEQKLKA